MDSKDLCFEGCLDMYGAHIRLCVKDYVEIHKHAPKLRGLVKTIKGAKKYRTYALLEHYESAERFLFGGGLADAIDKFSLPINIDCVHRWAREAAEIGILVDRGGYKNMLALEEVCDE
jgi:hypothetical protein